MRFIPAGNLLLARLMCVIVTTLAFASISYACSDAPCECGCARTATFNCPTGETERFCVTTDIDGDGIPEKTCFDKPKTVKKTVCVSCLACPKPEPKPEDDNDSGEESAD